MRLLTPTENRRLNELIGFLGITLAILMALALLSYSPHDASFNVSRANARRASGAKLDRSGGRVRRGLLFQVLGYAAFLLPMGILRARPALVSQPAARFGDREPDRIRAADSFAACPAQLWRIPDVRGAIPPGGLLGRLARGGTAAAFNSVGAHVVALACLFAGAVPDHAIFVHRHARAAARARQKARPHRQAEGALVGLAGDARARKAAQARGDQQGQRPAARADANAGRQGPQGGHGGGSGRIGEGRGRRGRRIGGSAKRAGRAGSRCRRLGAGKEERPPNRRSRAARPASGCLRRACCAWPSAAKRYRKTN